KPRIGRVADAPLQLPVQRFGNRRATRPYSENGFRCRSPLHDVDRLVGFAMVIGVADVEIADGAILQLDAARGVDPLGCRLQGSATVDAERPHGACQRAECRNLDRASLGRRAAADSDRWSLSRTPQARRYRSC